MNNNNEQERFCLKTSAKTIINAGHRQDFYNDLEDWQDPELLKQIIDDSYVINNTLKTEAIFYDNGFYPVVVYYNVLLDYLTFFVGDTCYNLITAVPDDCFDHAVHILEVNGEPCFQLDLYETSS
jgi:hypothetical protein